MRWNRFETNTGFKMVHKDLNHCLLKACFRGMRDLVPGLVDKGADINFLGQAKTGLSAELVGLTPISAAAHQGWPAVVRMLLDLGADHRGGIMDDPQYSEGTCLLVLCFSSSR
jgi:ankyrin repeat protein